MNHKSKELTSRHTKCTFVRIDLQSMLSSVFQGFTQVGQMFLMPFRLYHNIININFYNLADNLMEDIIHGPLVCCSSVLQPKGHDNPFEQTNMSWTFECSFTNIFLS